MQRLALIRQMLIISITIVFSELDEDPKINKTYKTTNQWIINTPIERHKNEIVISN